MIVNLKRSGVSSASRKTERVLLPRTLDSVWDLLELLLKITSTSDSSLHIDALAIDFADAFWQIPLGELERKFAIFEHDGAYYVFQRAPQGSRGAPRHAPSLWLVALPLRFARKTKYV